MKLRKIILFYLIFLGLAACRPTSSAPIPMATPTAVPPITTPAVNEVEVEVTRVIGTPLPTATIAPCTPLLAGMRLIISMAEQPRTVLLEVEGLLPEDKPILLLNGRSSAYTTDRANPIGPDAHYQESLYLGEADEGNSWSGQVIHQRGAVCFEFTFPLSEPLVLEAAAQPEPTPEVAAPGQSSGHSTQPVISADGSVIAFTSMGALTPGTRPDWSAYAYDVTTGQTELLSIRHDGQPVYDPIYAVALSADGRFAAYYSFDGEIVPDDPDLCTDGDWTELCEDLFIYDRQTGEIERIPVGRPSGLGKSYTISLSADGRFLAWLAITGTNVNHLAIFDLETGTVANLPAYQGVGFGGPYPNPVIGPDPNWIALRQYTEISAAAGLWLYTQDGQPPLFIAHNGGESLWVNDHLLLFLDYDENYNAQLQQYDVLTGVRSAVTLPNVAQIFGIAE